MIKCCKSYTTQQHNRRSHNTPATEESNNHSNVTKTKKNKQNIFNTIVLVEAL